MLTRVLYGFLIPVVVILSCVAAITQKQNWRGALPWLAGGPVVILVLLGWINNIKFGSPYLTGYHQWRPEDHGLTGVLVRRGLRAAVQRSWGIFVYFPLLLLARPMWRRFISGYRHTKLPCGLGGGVVVEPDEGEGTPGNRLEVGPDPAQGGLENPGIELRGPLGVMNRPPATCLSSSSRSWLAPARARCAARW